ncbi:hypothetical protein L596_002897 [Steinernema carpocapsae]|uniref:Uncharacterized protein n=1 Tax=Steinernema carpocapsae TaxID=34508 RepID=A0A4U8UQW1_STECR|nr:hypothetical protein L596_002897 [Steinernema carpocapsae]
MISSIFPSTNVLWDLSVSHLIALVCFIFVFCLYLLHLLAIAYGKYRLHRKVDPIKCAPGVSIIKPLVGRRQPVLQPGIIFQAEVSYL